MSEMQHLDTKLRNKNTSLTLSDATNEIVSFYFFIESTLPTQDIEIKI